MTPETLAAFLIFMAVVFGILLLLGESETDKVHGFVKVCERHEWERTLDPFDGVGLRCKKCGDPPSVKTDTDLPY